MNRLEAAVILSARELRRAIFSGYGVSSSKELTSMLKQADPMSLALLDLVQSLDNLDDQEHLPGDLEPEPEPLPPAEPTVPINVELPPLPKEIIKGSRYSERIPPFGLTAAEYVVLGLIYKHHGVMTSKDLYIEANRGRRRENQRSRSVLSDSVMRLRDRGGFVTTIKQGRGYVVELTRKGSSIYEQALRIIDREKNND